MSDDRNINLNDGRDCKSRQRLMRAPCDQPNEKAGSGKAGIAPRHYTVGSGGDSGLQFERRTPGVVCPRCYQPIVGRHVCADGCGGARFERMTLEELRRRYPGHEFGGAGVPVGRVGFKAATLGVAELQALSDHAMSLRTGAPTLEVPPGAFEKCKMTFGYLKPGPSTPYSRTLDELCADALVAIFSFWGIVGITGLCALTAVGFAIWHFCGK